MLLCVAVQVAVTFKFLDDAVEHSAEATVVSKRAMLRKKICSWPLHALTWPGLCLCLTAETLLVVFGLLHCWRHVPAFVTQEGTEGYRRIKSMLRAVQRDPAQGEVEFRVFDVSSSSKRKLLGSGCFNMSEILDVAKVCMVVVVVVGVCQCIDLTHGLCFPTHPL